MSIQKIEKYGNINYSMPGCFGRFFIVRFCIKDELKKTEKGSETSYYDVEITEKHKDEKEEVKETGVPVKTGII